MSQVIESVEERRSQKEEMCYYMVVARSVFLAQFTSMVNCWCAGGILLTSPQTKGR